MKPLLRLLLAVWIACGSLGVASAAVWLADSQKAYRVDAQQNLVHWVELQPGEHQIIGAGGGKAWLLSDQGGRLIDAGGNEVTRIPFASGPTAFAADASRGDLFVASVTGILRYDLQGQSSYLPLPAETILAMRAATGGELWALTTKWLYRFSKESGWHAEIELDETSEARPSDLYVDRLRGLVWLLGQDGAKAFFYREGTWTKLADLPNAKATSGYAYDGETGRLWRIEGAAVVGHRIGEKAIALDGVSSPDSPRNLHYDSEERTLWWMSGLRLVAWHLPSGKRTEIQLDDAPQLAGAAHLLPEFELGLPGAVDSAPGVLPLSIVARCGERACVLEGVALEETRLHANLADQILESATIDWEAGQARLHLPPNLKDGTYSLAAWIESTAHGRLAEFDFLLTQSEGRLMLANRTKANQAPSVNITAPGNNAVFHAPANIDLQVNATDADGTVKQVSYYRGSTLIGTATTTPFSYSWKSVSKGTYTLTAKATDNSGASTKSAAITVIVNQLPTVSLTSPANNASFTAPANLTLTASASDGDGSIAKVEFFEGSNLLGMKAASPYTFAWNGVAAGSYALTAKATDNRGGSKTSTAVAIKVNGVTPPTVNITAPADNTVILATASVTIKATAKSVGSTISKVEFYDGTTLLGSVAGSSATVYAQLTKGGFSLGEHMLTAKAFDAKGQSTLSAGIHLRVESAGPTVRITAPAEGALFSRNAPVPLSVEASSRQGSITLVEYFDQDTPIGSSDYSPFDFNWYGAEPGDHRLTAKATDSKGATAISAPVNIGVSSNIAPTVGLSYSGETFRVPATLTLTAYAADEDGSISKVEFFEGDNLLGTVMSPPFEFTWANVGRGIYQVSARATDNQGMSASTGAYEIHVDDTLPTIAITSPAAGATLWVGSSYEITLSGTVSGPAGTRVEVFQADNQDYAQGALVTGETFSAGLAPRSLGAGMLVARGITRSGASAQASVPVKVLRPLIWFTDPGEDAATYDEQFTVRGGFAAPQVEALTVNGQAAQVDGSRFSLGPIPLALGANFLMAEMTAVLPGGERVTADVHAVITRLASSTRTISIDRIDPFDANRVGGLPQVSLGKMWLEVRGSFTGGPDTQITVEDGLGSRVLARLSGGTYSAPIAVAPGENLVTARAFGPSGPEARSSQMAYGFAPSGHYAALVRMANPQSCSSVPSAPGSIALEAELQRIGNVPIVAVEFSTLETGIIGTVTQAPYVFQWNNVAAGIYRVRARALASVGSSAYSAPITIGVGQSISCALLAPPANTDNYFIYPGNVEVKAKARAFNGEVAKVEFFRDSVLLATKESEPYQFTWENAPKGRFELSARATTKGGVSATSRTSVIVADLAVALRASDTEYNQGLENLGAPAKVSLLATPSVHGAALDRIDFIASGSVISISRGSPYEYRWQNISPGTYEVIARAYGSNGASVDSVPVTIKVAPLWVMLDPSISGPLNAPARVFLKAQSKAWQGSVDRIEYFAGNTLIGSGGAYSVVEWKDIPAGNYMLTAKVYDTNGNSATSAPVKLDVLGPPTVKLVSPPDGATAPAGGSVTLEAEATAPGSRNNNVVFYRGSTMLSSVVSAPYRYVWTNLPLGTHTLTAETSTPQGARATSAPITLNVTNDPGASITAPQAGQSVSSANPVSVVVQATMPLRAIDRVEIFGDGALLTTITASGTASFTANYSWAGAAVGTHVLKATAYAKDGSKVDTAEVSFTVVGAVKVRLDSPHPLMTILSSDTFHLTARASQEAGRIAAVQFYSGDTLLKTVESEPFVFAWKNPPVGIHRLRARAIDGTGQYADTPLTAVRSIEQPVIALDPGIAGAAVETEHLRVTGRLVAPSASAFLVNGQLATTTIDDRFFVNNVPLQPGSNAVTLELKTEGVSKSAQTVEVTSLKPAPFLISVDRSEGFAPLRTNLIITNQERVPFARIEVDREDDGEVDHTITELRNDQAVVPLEYEKPGTYTILVSVWGTGGGLVFSVKLNVEALDPVRAALRSVARYQSLRELLRAGDVAASINLLGQSIREPFRRAFEALGERLTEVADAFGTVKAIDVLDEYIVLVVHRTGNGGVEEYEITVARDQDGITRFVGF